MYELAFAGEWFRAWHQFWMRRTNRASAPRRRDPARENGLSCEALEDRILLAAPTAHEQYMLELINLARRDPAAYAASLGINLNEGLPAGTLSTAMRQPLAFDPLLIDAAANHSQWMLNQQVFSHTGAGGSNPLQRMVAAGFQFTGSTAWAENIGYRATTGSINADQFTRLIAEGLFIDAGVPGRGHRVNLLNDNYMEIGIGLRTGPFQGFNAMMATQDFARTTTPGMFTGVVYDDDAPRNSSYNPGEGLGGITVRATRDGGGQTYTTTTWGSGGFTLPLPKGRYSFHVSGPGLGNSQFMPAVLIGTTNRKFDFVAGAIRQAPEIALSGNGLALIHGDTTPRAADGTDFGSANVGAFSQRSFTIHNIGNSALTLTGSPRVAMSGANPGDFVVTVQPPSQVSGGSSVTFTVQFRPTATGLRTATVEIASNDSNESPFRFAIAGQGTATASFSAFYSPDVFLTGSSAAASVLTSATAVVAQSLPESNGTRAAEALTESTTLWTHYASWRPTQEPLAWSPPISSEPLILLRISALLP